MSVWVTDWKHCDSFHCWRYFKWIKQPVDLFPALINLYWPHGSQEGKAKEKRTGKARFPLTTQPHSILYIKSQVYTTKAYVASSTVFPLSQLNKVLDSWRLHKLIWEQCIYISLHFYPCLLHLESLAANIKPHQGRENIIIWYILYIYHTLCVHDIKSA